MYGSYGMYSGNKCNFSASNMYKQAGVVNMSNSYNKVNGVMTSLPGTQNTSVIVEIVTPETSFAQLTNAFPGVQHIDYEQNPSPIVLSVRQTGAKTDGTVGIYTDWKGNQGTYTEQYVLPGFLNTLIPSPYTAPPPPYIPQQTVVYEQQNIIKISLSFNR